MTPNPPNSPNQSGFNFEPEYLEHDGVQHAFTGLLYVPAPGESERLAKMKEPRPQAVGVRVSQSVKVDFKTAMKFRARGQ